MTSKVANNMVTASFIQFERLALHVMLDYVELRTKERDYFNSDYHRARLCVRTLKKRTDEIHLLCLPLSILHFLLILPVLSLSLSHSVSISGPQ